MKSKILGVISSNLSKTGGLGGTRERGNYLKTMRKHNNIMNKYINIISKKS
jgi:hypothetical protein